MCTPTITKAAGQREDIYDVACTGLDLVITITPADPDEVGDRQELKFQALIHRSGPGRKLQGRHGTSRTNALDETIAAYERSALTGDQDFPPVSCWAAIRQEMKRLRAI